jgi:Z1 domain
MIKGKYYSAKCEENNYSIELQNCIEEACEYCLNSVLLPYDDLTKKEKRPLMMLGKIQSGKTRAFTGLMALAFDNGFDMVIILTKNSEALIQQTYKRMRREFAIPMREEEIDVYNIMKALKGLTEYELNKKLIIVSKKETRNLGRISNFISEYTLNQRKFCLIIDDEADTAGIGFNKIKESNNEFDLRTIATKVNTLRGSLSGCVFIQVTATPYALYLQPEFNKGLIEPVKPKLTVLVPSGKGYIGGEYYFLKSREEGHQARFIFEEVSIDEHSIVTSKKGDRRRFKEEEILTRQDKLQTFKRGLMNFIVGGCILRMKDRKAHYAYVIHTNTQQESHERIENIIAEFWKQIRNRNGETETIINGLISEAYADIEKSVRAYSYQMPTFDDIKYAFYEAVDKDYISITPINSNNDVASKLNEDTGEIRLRTPFSILVGGQVLDRGVTIPDMIGFYYGRNPHTMQQDTVLQHSRMFGYRDEKLLSVTRFYTTRRIYENMTKITEIDSALREDIENGKFDEGVYFISEDEQGQIIPCSPDKIRMSNIVMLKAGRRVLPVGFSPIPKSYALKVSQKIEKELSKIIDDNENGAILTTTDKLIEIIKLVYSIIQPDEGSERFITSEQFISTLQYLAGEERKSFIVVRRNRKLSKFKENTTIYSDAPDTSKGDSSELSVAQKVNDKFPVVILIHQDGSGDGWDGSEFWWPILVTPKDKPKTIFALKDPSGSLIKRKK